MSERTLDDAMGHVKDARTFHPDAGCTKESVAHTDLILLADEIDRLRQGLWDCAKWAGMDTDGNDTPRSVGGDLVKIAVDAVKEQRKDYDDLLDELPLVKPANQGEI